MRHIEGPTTAWKHLDTIKHGSSHVGALFRLFSFPFCQPNDHFPMRLVSREKKKMGRHRGANDEHRRQQQPSYGPNLILHTIYDTTEQFRTRGRQCRVKYWTCRFHEQSFRAAQTCRNQWLRKVPSDVIRPIQLQNYVV